MEEDGPFIESLKGMRIGGRYVVDKVLGSGGMGVVATARYPELHQRVAIKFLRPQHASNAILNARFVREGRLAARVKSEHFVRVFDIGKLATGVPYLVMELLAGHDLADELIEKERFAVEPAVEWVLEALVGLAEIHALGVVHRDLKPSNLSISEAAGRRMVKVLDFGISKENAKSDSGAPLTSTDNLLGTPQYMSPEQVRASKDVDERSDIWAIGVILYELLTGKRPFVSDENATGELFAKVLYIDPLAPREHRPDLAPELEAVIMKCLHRDREARYPNVLALAEALRPFAAATAEHHLEAVKQAAAMKRSSLVPPADDDDDMPPPASQLETTSSSPNAKRGSGPTGNASDQAPVTAMTSATGSSAREAEAGEQAAGRRRDRGRRRRDRHRRLRDLVDPRERTTPAAAPGRAATAGDVRAHTGPGGGARRSSAGGIVGAAAESMSPRRGEAGRHNSTETERRNGLIDRGPKMRRVFVFFVAMFVAVIAALSACKSDPPATVLQSIDLATFRTPGSRRRRSIATRSSTRRRSPTRTRFRAPTSRSSSAKSPYSRPSFLETYQSNGIRASDAIANSAQNYSINPLVLLVLLETTEGLIGQRNYPFPPERVEYVFNCGCTQKTTCEPQLAGLDRQVDCVARKLRESLDAINQNTKTASGWGVNTPMYTLDNQAVTPANDATAALYDWNPRLAIGQPGGQWVFWNVWNLYAQYMSYSGPLGTNGGKWIGDACNANDECQTVQGAVCADNYPNGMCVVECSESVACPSGQNRAESFCAKFQDGFFCVPTCNPQASACRDGGQCVHVRGAQGDDGYICTQGSN